MSRAAAACECCGEQLAPADRFCEACGSRRPDVRDHLELALPGAAAAVSNRGLRHQHNEDAFELARLTAARDGVDAVLAVVCDGVSSGPRPDLASAEAARAGMTALSAALRRRSTPSAATREAVAAAGAAVAELAARPGMPGAPACTFVSAVHTPGEVTVGWIGDSRAYWLPIISGRPGARLTEDDSWLAVTLAHGSMSPDAAAADRRAHALTAWLGADAPGTPRLTAIRPNGPGLVLVCTDGLWNYLPDPERLAAALAPSAQTDPLAAARTLVRAALIAGGRDNVTAVLLPVSG
ncbi:PP2C family protein-serine/threonine phosphatase [Pseudonocardia acaciae]|uniref:PP2C family protein-serine/threonine phosphatase n=1 Tax=Pseudonocardia acaciae TaxID=551276 RepID=UPI000683EC33|nr:protein phosphatase 2C domain-containing protein [Pseudonocardia acaciae]